MSPRITIDRERIAEFCRRNRIRKLALFGSVLRDDFGPDSDVDVLVEFEPGQMIGFRIFDIEDELCLLLVSTRTPGHSMARVVGMRHRIVHDYLHVDYDIVWAVVQIDLPGLIGRLEGALPPEQR